MGLLHNETAVAKGVVMACVVHDQQASLSASLLGLINLSKLTVAWTGRGQKEGGFWGHQHVLEFCALPFAQYFPFYLGYM